MSNLAEKTLLMLLSDTDSLEVLVKEGLAIECVPTVVLRDVVTWSMTYYRQSGVAPTPSVLTERFEDLLSDHEIDPAGDVEETIEWAIDALKSAYVQRESHLFTRRMATEIAEAAPEDKIEVLSRMASELSSLTMSLQPRTSSVDMRESGLEMLADYEESVRNQGQIRGLSLGAYMVDRYTGGIHDGELAIMAGPPKSGKSFFVDYVAYSEWERERAVALFTLENSIKMTEMRIACQALHIDVTELQSGALEQADYDRLVEWVNDVLHKSQTPLMIMSPNSGMRTAHAIVQQAKAYGAESLVVDQLTFMEAIGKYQARTYELREIVHDLKSSISTGRRQVPCVLAHQVKRDGITHAERTGRLRMEDMAESAEVERSGDWVFGLWQSEDARAISRMQVQVLAARRAPTQTWDFNWQPHRGIIQPIAEVEMP